MKICVISTKGGVGKSFVSANVIAPAMYIVKGGKEKIKLAELDTTNFTANYLQRSEIVSAVSIDLSFAKGDDVKMRDEVARILTQDYEVYDIGSNMAESVVATIGTGLIHIFDFVFVPACLENGSETQQAISVINTFTNFFGYSNIYMIANKYSDTATTQKNLSKIQFPDEKILKIPNTSIYNTVMSKAMTIYDIYESIDLQKNRSEIVEAIKNKDYAKIDELSKQNLLKQKAMEFYDMNSDFQKLINLLGGAK